MASFVTLDDVSFGDEEIDAAFRRWREAIEQANHWSVSGPVEFDAGPTVKVYSNFRVAVPAGTRLVVAPDGADYKLVGADCLAS